MPHATEAIYQDLPCRLRPHVLTLGNGLSIKPSTIDHENAGFGSFAEVHIYKRRRFTFMEGTLMENKEAKKVPEKRWLRTLLGQNLVLDGIRGEKIERGQGGPSVANDGGEQSNASFVNAEWQRVVPICYLVAKRGIDVGMEILVNYGHDHWGDQVQVVVPLIWWLGLPCPTPSMAVPVQLLCGWMV